MYMCLIKHILLCQNVPSHFLSSLHFCLLILLQAGDESGGGWGLPIFQDTDVVWGEDEKTTPQKRYFRAEYFTEEDTGAKSELET